MEIRAGQYYRTRDGRKAYVGWICPVGLYPAVGHVEGDNNHERWQLNGRNYTDDAECKEDLVAEWREPASAEVRLALYWSLHNVPRVMVLHEDEIAPANGVIECRTIRFTEGKGIEVL